MPHFLHSPFVTTYKKYTITTLVLCIIVTFMHLPAQAQPNKKTIKKRKLQTTTATGRQLSFVIIPAEGNTFGYDILNHNKKMIHQPSIPGMAGNRGFTKKRDAGKVAKLVINKINHNLMPPTVSKHELDSLKIKL